MTIQGKNLTKNEWAILSALWQSGKPLAVAEIVDALREKLDWPYQRYLTQLARLADKGFIGYERRGRNKVYYPEIGMDECIREESKSITERMTSEASNRLMLNLLKDAKQLSKEDATELKQLVSKLRSQDDE